MAQSNDSSVLFSLKELMGLEQERLKQEETARREAAEAADRARQEEERRERERSEARLKAADEERRIREQRAREEATRLDAIRQGEIERARLDAENHARMESLRRQQEHEREIVLVRERSGKKRLRVWVGVLLASLVVAFAGGGVALHWQMEKAAEAAANLRKVRMQVDELDAQRRELEQKLATPGQNQEAIDTLNRRLKELEEKRDRIEKSVPTPAKPIKPPIVTPKTDNKQCVPCRPGDPLCDRCM
jgi:colicin import membrane protein